MNFSILFTDKFKRRFKELELLRQKSNDARIYILMNSNRQDKVLGKVQEYNAVRSVFNGKRYWWMCRMPRIDTYGCQIK